MLEIYQIWRCQAIIEDISRETERICSAVAIEPILTYPETSLQRLITPSDYETLLVRWFPNTAQQTANIAFAEKDIREIVAILECGPNKEWSRIPRIYIILRMINHLDAIEGFIEESITDAWFPFTQTSLPHSLTSNSARLRFLEIQDDVFNTQALKLERAEAGHGHFRNQDDIPLRKIGDLGKGGSGFVERVLSTITHREYALKLLPRGKNFRRNKEVLRDFEKELHNMKRILQADGHHHIVSFVGSKKVHSRLGFIRHADYMRTGYTDPRYVCIVMSPVADYHLGELLEHPKIKDRRWRLRSYFGCLISALW